jgi:hypothetical protein
LDPGKWEMVALGPSSLTAEVISRAEESQPAAICIASLPPGELAHTRYLCKRLRARFAGVRILVGRWGLRQKSEENWERLKDAGADEIAITLLETRAQLNAWLPILNPPTLAAAKPVAVAG